MIKAGLLYLFLYFSAVPARALTVEVERIDAGAPYTAIQDTETIKYVDRCTRGKFKPYEWKTWEGYYSARAYIMPIAIISVQRENEEIFGGDMTPFIKTAQAEAGKIGANLLCWVKIKTNKRILEPEVIVFRAYKQLFQAGNAGWEAFFTDLMNQGVLLTLQDLQLGEKTREALERQAEAQKKK